MIKIDNKDKKILFYLLKDSRQTLRQIGKKVGISRELASYRINRLIDKKIITGFIINISTGILGYSFINHYYKYKNINPEIKNEIINYFVNSKLTTYVSSIEGIYDFQVESIIGDPHEYEAFMDEIKKRYHKYIQIEYAQAWIGGDFFDYPFLFDENENKLDVHKWTWGGKLYQIDDLEFKILQKLSNNSRKPTKDIANDLNSTVSIINNRIQKLVQKGIIEKFTISIDWSKIGYKWFHLRINLSEYDKKNQIISYIKKNPHCHRLAIFMIKEFRLVLCPKPTDWQD